MKLVLYSGGTRRQNHKLNTHLIEILPRVSKIAYIPSSSDSKRKHFKEFKEWFGYYGYNKFMYFDIDEEFEKGLIPEFMDTDAVYLSGGNTFHFLYNIKKRNLIKLLREYAKSKVVIGLSAGSYIMTPTIEFSVVHHKLKGDFKEKNIDDLTDYNSLGLVDFEFVPHYEEGNKEKAVQKYLKNCTRSLCGCSDGSGIIVNGDKATYIGEVMKFK